MTDPLLEPACQHSLALPYWLNFSALEIAAWTQLDPLYTQEPREKKSSALFLISEGSISCLGNVYEWTLIVLFSKLKTFCFLEHPIKICSEIYI